MSDQYWAAKPADEIGSDILKRVEEYYTYIRRNGRLEMWRRAYEYYYTAVRAGGRVYYSGESDEYTNVEVNDFRNLLLHLKSMIMAQRIAFEPQAINTDHKSMAQTILAKSILETEVRDSKLETLADRLVEMGLIFGEGYMELKWDVEKGDEVSYDENVGVVKAGALDYFAYGPTDIAFDFMRVDTDHDWYITRHLKNKYDLAARFPDLEEAIMAASFDLDQRETVFGMNLTEDTDLIPLYTLHHKPTEALPDGRYVELVGSDAVLMEGPYPYEDIQIYEMQPSNQKGTPFGYSVSYDLLPLQEALNALYSTVATNQSNFGVQNVLVPQGSNMDVVQVTDGLNWVEYNATVGKPEALNLTYTPKEIFDFIGMIQMKMETIAGVSQVARNSAQLGELSGAAMALLQATSIQFNSDLQKAYVKMMERIGNGIVSIYQTYAQEKRVATIVGKANKPLIKEWSSEDIDEIQRVTVDVGNPLTNTTSGKMAIADQLMAAGMVDNPTQYIQLLETGRLEPLIQGDVDELLNIKSENEHLSDGKEVQTVITDNHAMHIIEHKMVIASPEAREDPEVLDVTLKHINEHLNHLRTADPLLLRVTGQQPAPPNPKGAPGVELPQANPAEGAAAQEAGVNLPNQPDMPKNPMTGKPFNVVDGGQ